MTAAETLARWREAEQGATEGPWFRRYNDIVPSASNDDDDRDTRIVRGRHGAARGDKRAMADATFIATSREAMPALLAFAEAVLALATTDRTVCFCVTQERLLQVAERHLTTSSTPTTGEGMDKPLAVTGSGRTADAGGLDSPGVGTSTTTTEGTNA